MGLEVRDLVPAFLAFWDNAPDGWDEYVGQHPEVLDDLTNTGRTLTSERRERALATYREQEERIWVNAPHGVRWIEEAAARVVPLLEAEHVDLQGVAMVGLGTSNGWVSGGKLYLAVEQILDERSARILATHEIAHALQLPLPAEPWPSDTTLGCTVYAEGFATALTAELFPEYTLAEHLWFGPGYDDWLADCEQQQDAAAAAILRDLDAEDGDTLGRYLAFGGEREFPTRIGYFIGTRLIQALRRDHTWPELARWSTTRAMDAVRTQLVVQ
ncbi:DUF2268 domain-containing putative Zn-dependent protease [Kribbella sp. NBC_01505]|uniref:DUF2268 domain-containing putative Zn-dependent protease n=1 Tax=Kribbella sp. NBC_01505 TaxID=2903580 RepID=UPI00386E0D37